LTKIGQLTFEEPDETRFPALALARSALERGGTACTLLNAANEIAVEAFLEGRLSFYGITRIVEGCLEAADARGSIREPADLDEVLEADAAGRAMARALLSGKT
jgi:1-deoxy-D-xylulose-5-phosphate reductoisomerase